MNYTQNEKIMPITEKALAAGIDIVKAVHYARPLITGELSWLRF